MTDAVLVNGPVGEEETPPVVEERETVSPLAGDGTLTWTVVAADGDPAVSDSEVGVNDSVPVVAPFRTPTDVFQLPSPVQRLYPVSHGWPLLPVVTL